MRYPSNMRILLMLLLAAGAEAGQLETIRARHTCAHRARELMSIVAALHAEPQEIGG